MKPEEREELLTAYALDTLSEPDAAAVSDLVRTDSAAAEELAAYHEIVDLIALSAPLRRADPALRSRVVQAARRERSSRGRRWTVRHVLPWTAAAAVAVLAMWWGSNLQQDIDALRRDNATLTAVVESDAKQLEALLTTGGDLSSQVLQLQFESATADLQLGLAVSTSPDVRSTFLQPTDAGHGAGGHFLWSPDMGAGWLTAYDLPPLPLGSVYQVWLASDDQVVAAGTFLPDQSGRVEVAVQPGGDLGPRRILIAVAPEGGLEAIGSPLVLDGAFGP